MKFRLPDNLTTWRATARGVTSDTKVGMTTSKVVSRKDVILRLETPRFLTQGDTVTLSGIVQTILKKRRQRRSRSPFPARNWLDHRTKRSRSIRKASIAWTGKSPRRRPAR